MHIALYAQNRPDGGPENRRDFAGPLEILRTRPQFRDVLKPGLSPK